MPDSGKDPEIPGIPPPPPGPPLPVPLEAQGSCCSAVSSNKNQSVVHNLKRLQSQETSWKKTSEELVKDVILKNFLAQSSAYLAHLRPVVPVVQDGPCCGLVAVCMLAQLCGPKEIDVDTVFESARKLGFTKQGEIFSASDMLTLAMHVCPCDGHLIEGKSESHMKDQVLKALIGGHTLIVPYDRDSNNEPCLKRGHKAHWAIITGYLAELEQIPDELKKAYIKDGENPLVHYLNTTVTCDSKLSEKHLSTLINQNISVFACQGKSIRTHLWSLDKLLQSNAQLEELDPSIEGDINNFVIKEEGIRLLCRKIVAIKM